MPTKKYEWNAYDRCAAEAISSLMKTHGFSDRGMASALGNVVSYNRIRDLRMALKAPVRLSEFLAICDVCHADPVQTLRDVIEEARRIQVEQAAQKHAEESRTEPDFLTMAAKHGDTEAEQEAYEEEP